MGLHINGSVPTFTSLTVGTQTEVRVVNILYFVNCLSFFNTNNRTQE